MNFALSEDHELLRDSARSFLDKEIDLAPLLVPGATVKDAGYEANWSKMAELGWAGLVIPEEFGGSDMTLIDLTMVVNEVGRTLAPSPMLGVLGGTWALLKGGSDEQKAGVLSRVAAGELKLALAVADSNGNADGPGSDAKASVGSKGHIINGSKSFVIDAAAAGMLVVAADTNGAREWFLVDAKQNGVQVETLAWRDVTRQVCTVHFRDAAAERLEADDATIWPWVRDRILLVLAAESAAGLQQTLTSSVNYAKERVAFGKPIGAFQSIKHVLAGMFGASECANTAVLFAAWALTENDPKASISTAIAKAYCTEAYVTATNQNIQIFGAIGFTWEMKNHLYFKRARANAEMFGSPARQRERVIDILRQKAA
jgi:alkylation response protein AidB-like acyl-CoA dehydrogenase